MRTLFTSLSVCLLLLAPILQLWSMVPATCNMVASNALLEEASCCTESTESTESVENNQSGPAFRVLMARPDCCLKSECCVPSEPLAELPCALASNQPQAEAPLLPVTVLAAAAPLSFNSCKNTLHDGAERYCTTVRSRLSRNQSWRI